MRQILPQEAFTAVVSLPCTVAAHSLAEMKIPTFLPQKLVSLSYRKADLLIAIWAVIKLYHYTVWIPSPSGVLVHIFQSWFVTVLWSFHF